MCNVCRSKLCSSTRWRSAARTGEMVHLRCGSNGRETLFVLFTIARASGLIYIARVETAGGWFMGLKVLHHPNNKRVLRFYFAVYWISMYGKKWMNFSWCFLFDVEQRVHNNAHYPLSFHTSVTPGLINCKREVKTVCLHDYRIGSMHQLRLFAKTIITRILLTKTSCLCHPFVRIIANGANNKRTLYSGGIFKHFFGVAE